VDDDLLDVAVHLHAKRVRAGDGDRSRLVQYKDLHDLDGLDKDSRLIIVGHCDPDSTLLSPARQLLTPLELAEYLNRNLPEEGIKRVSLLMCFSGGNRGKSGTVKKSVGKDGKTQSQLADFLVSPFDSFGYKVAERCSRTQTITARSGKITGQMRRDWHYPEDCYKPGPLHAAAGIPDDREPLDVYRTVSGRYKGHRGGYEADKLIFTPKGGTKDRPVHPGVSFTVAPEQL
jgi:hypothetical protein